MENLTPAQIIAVIIGALLAVAGFVNTVGSAWEKIAKVRKAAKAPEVQQDGKIAELDERLTKVEDWLKKDKIAIEDSRESRRVLTQGMLALLDHALNGNNVEQMKSAKTELNSYLVNH